MKINPYKKITIDNKAGFVIIQTLNPLPSSAFADDGSFCL